MLQRYLLVWLVLSSLAAYWWPVWWFGASLDPFLSGGKLLPWLIVTTMTAIGMMLPRDEIRQVLRRWPTVLGGTVVQYVSMPLMAFAMGKLWGLEGDYLIGIVMVGCVPGAMASNVLTLNAGGNTSYSVSLTTVATLLSPLAVPLALGLLLSSEQRIDRTVLNRASIMLLLTVVIPVVAGHLLARFFPRHWERSTRRIGSTVANLTILWIIAVVVALNREPLSHFRLDLLFALLGLNVAGYLAGYCGSIGLRLGVPMRRALTLEVGMQNAGLGAVLATTLFAEQQQATVAIAPAMYTFGCMFTGTILAAVWAVAGRKSNSAAKEATTSADRSDA